MSDASQNTPPEQDDFFVGYAPMSTRLASFMLLIAVAILGAVTALGVLVAGAQDDPGDGVWATSAIEITGRMDFVPYPAVHVGEGPYAGRTVLLISQGKFGVSTRAQPFDGDMVTVRGLPVERGDGLALEVVFGDTAIQAAAADTAPVTAPAVEALQETTLSGMIVDSKCYLGVMKPGDGKAHKACATLCILGGIPPSLVVRHDEGEPSVLILTGPNGEPLTARSGSPSEALAAPFQEQILPFVADPIRVTGRLARQGSLTFLRIDPAEIKRL